MKIINRRVILTFVVGLFIILLLRIIYIIANFVITYFEFSNLNTEQIALNISLHAFTVFVLFRIIVSVLSLIIPIIVGFFVAKRLKGRGFLYGLVFGIIYFILVYVLFFVMYLLFGHYLPANFLSDMPRVFLETVVLVAFGGWLGKLS